MKTILTIVGIIFIAALTSYAVVQNTQVKATAQKETAFDRVMRTNTIRCGYYIYPPVTYRDINTGKLSGFSVDMMEYIGKKTGLKIEWTEEVTFGNWQVALDNGRFDVACTPNWPSTALGRLVLFGKPMFYAGIHVIGKAGDTRFKTLEDVNKPEVRISVHEANEILYLVEEVFPKATLVILPSHADGQQPILDVMTGKADLIVSDKNAVAQWNPHHDEKLAVLAGGARVKLQAFDLAVAARETELNNFLNNAIDEMLATGAIDRMLDQWMEYKGIYLPVVSPAKE